MPSIEHAVVALLVLIFSQLSQRSGNVLLHRPLSIPTAAVCGLAEAAAVLKECGRTSSP